VSNIATPPGVPFVAGPAVKQQLGDDTLPYARINLSPKAGE
jgi:hypothetical protein